MASPAQIQANRLNAEKSTGPRTTEGKAISRFNALKSGIDAKSIVIPGEDPAELAALAADYQLQFQPASPVEQFLVDAIIYADWILRRLRRVEAQFWEMSAAGLSINDSLRLLLRRIGAEERSYFRSLKELQRQIAARAESGEAFDAEIGFVSSPVLAAPPPAPQPCPPGPPRLAAGRPAPPLGNPALRL